MSSAYLRAMMAGAGAAATTTPRSQQQQQPPRQTVISQQQQLALHEKEELEQALKLSRQQQQPPQPPPPKERTTPVSALTLSARISQNILFCLTLARERYSINQQLIQTILAYANAELLYEQLVRVPDNLIHADANNYSRLKMLLEGYLDWNYQTVSGPLVCILSIDCS